MQGSLMVDIEGLWLTAEDRQFLKHPEIGGLILFTRNTEDPKQVRELCASIRAIRPDLILAIDQEGGRVQRLRQNMLKLPAMGSFIEHPNALALANYCGWLMATEVLAIGLDISFAPVLDINYDRNQVIGKRAFANNPEKVTELASAFITGMQKAGMQATGKHFPGHGWVTGDSHFVIPEDERSLDEIRKTDLIPFTKLSQQLVGIMPAHIIYTQVDNKPAGFSAYWIQTILRQELQFKGIIFSDDLSMVGAHAVGDIHNRVAAAFGAGCDIALVCNNRAMAEEALISTQKLNILPSQKLAMMKTKVTPSTDYKSQPDWLEAVRTLQQAQLLV
ncbi:beta-N-acetylhexosaminidase [Entomomonas sp. E2T0]|uniref:beta-N-acetylhexosaminidase n=1 Tax=Entomomonas sp. E2T0 TaxID=2930213 RepID=UPI0022282CFF|nr:beta-N-acetylhexosaminidase [Entomomonas sp. E2T0]UYZ85428.1 beta-N-acetylhexosaminidase [Entomomonas sp. E2T0]